MSKVVLYISIFFGQIVYINGLIYLNLRFYDSLPRFLTALVFLFVLPIALGVIFALLMNKLIDLLDLFVNEEKVMAFFVGPALIFWLFLVVGNYIGIREYFDLQYRGMAQDVPLQNIDSYQHKAYLKLQPDSIIRKDLLAAITIKRRVKSGDSYSTRYDTYEVAPVVSKTWNSEMKILAWTKSFPKDYRPGMSLQFLIVKDPYEIAYIEKAIGKAVQHFSLQKSKNPIILSYTDLDFEEILEKYKNRFLYFVLTCNIIFILLPWVFIRKLD
ncbi:MAG: hypothetical protein H7A25_01300 [Leptospiraceae bacterium]|nr:hypothetical protein [Leptospiraceae bacterium]